MTPLPTPAEIAAAQERCRDAWRRAQEAEGLEKLRLINQAFPFAITGGGNGSGLRIKWHQTESKWVVADAAGFVTLVDKDDIFVLLIAIIMESARTGAFREIIVGEKPIREKPIPSKVTIEDLGLGKKPSA